MLVTAIAAMLSAGSFIIAERWWDLIPASLGAILGAAGAAIPAYLLADKASSEARDRETNARADADLALLMSAFAKLLEIVNGSYTICYQVNEMLDNSLLAGHSHWRLWQRVLPIIGVADERPERIKSEEVALFMRAERSASFANDLIMIDRRYSALISHVAAYAVRREALMHLLPSNNIANGVGTTELTKDEAAKVIPMMYALDQMADSLIDRMHDVRREAQALSERFNDVAKLAVPNRTVPGFRSVD